MNGPPDTSTSTRLHETVPQTSPGESSVQSHDARDESSNGDQRPAQPKDISSLIIQYLSTSSNEALICVFFCIVGATYVLLGRLGLLLIGLVSGAILHSLWEGTSPSDVSNPIKRRELSLNVANRLLEWRRREPIGVEIGFGAMQPFIAKDILELPAADYSSFRPRTAAALDSLTDAVIKDYVNHWYEPILPSETEFPRACRSILTGFVKSMASHLARKRTTDTFLEFLTNASSIVIVFLSELSTAIGNVEPSTNSEEAIQRYLEQYPESSLANVLAEQQQRKKLKIIADDILSSFLDPTVYACAPFRTFCQEVLCGVVLESAISSLSQPECINSWIIHLFSEGESEIMNAIDAGVEGARNQGVATTKWPESVSDAPRPTSSPGFDSNTKSSCRTSQETFECADKATEEAMSEAKRLSALIAAQDLQIGSNDKGVTETSVALQDKELNAACGVMVGKKDGAIDSGDRQEDTRSLPNVAVSRTNTEGTTRAGPALSPPMQTSHSSHENSEQHLSMLPLTLHHAYISVDDGSESSEALVRSKPAFSYMLQVEPTSSRRTGWMVFRTYKDFEFLHETLGTISRLNKMKSFTDNYPSLPSWKGLTNRALAKSLEQYLQAALQHESLAECERMRRFLGKEGPVSPESKPTSTKPSFFSTQVTLETVGRGVLDALSNAPRGVSNGSKTVLSGMTGVFGANSNRGSSSVPDVNSVPPGDFARASDESGGLPQRTPFAQTANTPAYQTDRSGLPIFADQLPSNEGSPDNLRPAVEGLVDLQATPIRENTDSALKEHFGRNSESITSHQVKAGEVACLDESPEKSLPNKPNANQAPPLEYSASADQMPSITHEETRVAIELIFAVINELYTLSSAWNIRRTLLNAAKSYILRPGNPNLETIRDLLQNSMIDANTSDDAIGLYLAKLRENTLPTKSELDSWPAPPSDVERERLRETARRVFVQRGLPQALTSVMGAAASREALEKVFDCLQVHSVARGFVFSILLQALRAIIL